MPKSRRPQPAAASTGSAGAIIFNGGTAVIGNGLLGADKPQNLDQRKHFARNYAANSIENDGNKEACAGAVIVRNGAQLTVKNKANGWRDRRQYRCQEGTVYVTENGRFVLEGDSKIVGNYNYTGGAVTVGAGRFNERRRYCRERYDALRRRLRHHGDVQLCRADQRRYP